MKFSPSQVVRLEMFLEGIKNATYPEPSTALHETITGDMLAKMLPQCHLPAGARVLDVGCGQGVALRHFAQRGLDAVGITINATDLEACRKQGFRAEEMDQSFLEFPDGHFDLVWCRHCLEHSVFPFFTLSGFYRALKAGGFLYVEVPAPDTPCHHQTNQNHYSVMGKSMHAALMRRAGFKEMCVTNMEFNVTGVGKDTYWGFLMQKP